MNKGTKEQVASSPPKMDKYKNSKQETLIIIITAANVGIFLKANPSE
jgi:hypothetical protein